MTDETAVDAIEAAAATEGAAPEAGELSLEATMLLVTTDTITRLETKTREELSKLRERQGHVTFLHKVLRGINHITDAKGSFDLTDHADLIEFLEQAKELGVEVDTEKLTYTSDERQRLIENIRIASDDLNMQNDMQIQTVTRLTNERYEAFQMARSILKPLHEDKINKARAISGR